LQVHKLAQDVFAYEKQKDVDTLHFQNKILEEKLKAQEDRLRMQEERFAAQEARSGPAATLTQFNDLFGLYLGMGSAVNAGNMKVREEDRAARMFAQETDFMLEANLNKHQLNLKQNTHELENRLNVVKKY